MTNNLKIIISVRGGTYFFGSVYKDSIRCIHYFQKGVDNFEIQHKTCKFLARGAVPP